MRSVNFTSEEVKDILKVLDSDQNKDNASLASVSKKIKDASEAEHNQNTLFLYLYRDAGNYKTCNEVVLKGKMTDRDFELIRSCCDGGEFFIPSEVGLEEDRGFEEFDPEFDLPWFELVGYSLTGRRPSDIAVKDLVKAFRRMRGHWEEEEPAGAI